MEAAAVAAVAAARAGSLRMSPAFSSRKEWRAVSENQPSRSTGNEADLDRQKVGQVDERTIYEVPQRRQSLDMNVCAITIDATSEDEVLRQLEGLSRKSEDLQQLEIQLRDRIIAKSEISEIKCDFDAQIKEHVDAAVKFQAKLPQISSNFHNSLALDSPKQNVETKEYTTAGSIESMADEQGPESEQTNIVAMSLPLVSKSYETIDGSDLVGEVRPDMISGGQSRVGAGAKSPDSSLLDKRSLSALRLAKMLAPLHWHDYKKKYGRLDEFVASHPDFFLIESDCIQLREGAQEMIATEAAVAKIAAVAAASTTYSSALPSVAVTPMVQAHRLKHAPSLGSKQFHAAENNLVSLDDPLHVSGKHNYQNGVNFNISSGASSIKILTKAKDSIELNGVVTKVSHLSNFVAKGEYVDKSGISSNQNKVASNGTLGSHLILRPQGRHSSNT